MIGTGVAEMIGEETRRPDASCGTLSYTGRMPELDEKLMEDCARDLPEVFLGEALKLLHQQEKFGGQKPDLVFEDESEDIVVVEVQRKALDRGHLYRSIEYRDHLRKRYPDKNIRVLLFCNELPDRYLDVLTLHNIEIVTLPESEMLELAEAYRPTRIKEWLRRRKKSTQRNFAYLKGEELNTFRRYEQERGDLAARLRNFRQPRWGRDTSDAVQYLVHFSSEIGDQEDLSTHERIVWTIAEVFESIRFHLWAGPQTLIVERASKGQPVVPPITLHMRVTNRGDFLLTYTMDDSSRGTFRFIQLWEEDCSRPDNVLMFIKGFEGLEAPSAQTDEGIIHPAAATLVFATRAAVNNMILRLKLWFDVTLASEFAFDFRDRPKEATDKSEQPLSPPPDLVSWRIYDVAQRQAEEDRQWLDTFDESYGIAPEFLLAEFRATELSPGRTSYSLNKQGVTITPAQLTKIVERLRRAHRYLYDYLIEGPRVDPVDVSQMRDREKRQTSQSSVRAEKSRSKERQERRDSKPKRLVACVHCGVEFAPGRAFHIHWRNEHSRQLRRGEIGL